MSLYGNSWKGWQLAVMRLLLAVGSLQFRAGWSGTDRTYVTYGTYKVAFWLRVPRAKR
jgi:hypothetical protein